MSKTITQIAAELNVSRQAVHQKIKKEPLSSNLQQFTSIVDGTVYISEIGENLIKSAFERKEASTQVDSNALQVFQKTIECLQAQLEIKDKQIQQQLEAKDKQIEALNERLSESHLRLSEITNALTTQQALHAGTIQQQLLEDSSEKNNEKMGKQSIWAKIFKK